MDNTPKKDTKKKYINFLINTDRDADILKWVAEQDNKSEAIRGAIRLAMQQNGYAPKKEITLEDIYNELQEIKRTGIVISETNNNDDKEEPADIVRNLNKLGL